MNMYLLKPIEPQGWDSNTGWVIAARDSAQARSIAQGASKHGCENYSYADDSDIEFWLDISLSTCEMIGVSEYKLPGIVLNSYKAG